jgi:hypothetical protein
MGTATMRKSKNKNQESSDWTATWVSAVQAEGSLL